MRRYYNSLSRRCGDLRLPARITAQGDRFCVKRFAVEP